MILQVNELERTGDISWSSLENHASKYWGCLQQSGRYQEPENVPVFEYYHNEPNLAGIIGSVVRW